LIYLLAALLYGNLHYQYLMPTELASSNFKPIIRIFR